MFSPHSQMELSGVVLPAALTTAAAEPAAELLAGSEPAVEPPGHLQRFMVRDPSTGKFSVKEPSTVEEAIALALGPAFTPSPRAVTARDAFTPRMASELEEQSFTSWCAGGAIPYAPTTALWRRECKESLILASTPRSMQERREAESARPDATEPADMAEYWHMAGWDAMAPAFFKPIPARQLLPGQLPAANICALYAAHVATGECESCNARKPCYTGAVCNLLQDVTWPWKGGTPPPPATAVPPPQPYDKRRTEQTLKLLERGTYIEITDPTVVRAWGQVLNAPRRNPVLTEQEVACISADGSAPAAVAASARAQTFVSTLKAALLRGHARGLGGSSRGSLPRGGRPPSHRLVRVEGGLHQPQDALCEAAAHLGVHIPGGAAGHDGLEIRLQPAVLEHGGGPVHRVGVADGAWRAGPLLHPRAPPAGWRPERGHLFALLGPYRPDLQIPHPRARPVRAPGHVLG